MNEPISAQTPRLGFLQVLRAVAALLVLVFHCGREWTWGDAASRSHLFTLAGICDFGVDLFFVISGFVMVHVTIGRRTGWAAGRRFLLRRLLRVGPMYWLATLLFILPVLAAPQMLHRSGYSLAYILASFGFIPWQRPEDVIPSVSPIYGLGWTLNYEMAFYLLFAVMIGLSVRRPVLVMAGLLGVLALIGFFVPPIFAQAYFYTRTLLIEFVLGAGLCLVFRSGARLPTTAGAALMLLGLAGWLIAGLSLPVHDGTTNLRGLAWGVPAALILMAIALTPAISGAFEAPSASWLRRLGDASFSLYLCHLFVIRILSIGLRHVGLTAPPAGLFVALVIAGSCAAALGVHRLVERPILRLDHRWLGSTTTG